ncbi:hypothetical protein G647_05737 [Cladophialophora carrionii CBS 160.54]|uniref:Transcription factor domain-containing protein n=1 Tax=Cladophialophora carrionii CBS 160.54 TaxID=1279043 RepID=V9DAR9_9EURO|nr:uncharacterized protein G647_05737 [Cladophialophora carrionii CBS 160.54]ETI23930.1 hypothetical protein G647_05737 [Cladophialophora carrionii CBS 160.54]
MLELQVNATAVRLLSEQMRNPQTAATEANIWAVVALGYSGYGGEIRTGKCPRQSSLKELQSLHIYGRLVINKVYVAGLMRLVQMLGGVDKITTPGIAQLICFADRFESSRLYGEADRLAVSVAEREWAESTMGSSATSFPMVWPDPQDEALSALLGVIQDMADFTIVVENYVEGRFVPRPPVVLTDQRNYIQHRLMSLESLEEIESRRTALPLSPDGHDDLATIWIHKIMSEPGCLYAYFFAQLMRNKYSRHFHSKAQRQLLHAHIETVSYVNKALSDPSTACSELTILTVFNLAYQALTPDLRTGPVDVPSRDHCGHSACSTYAAGRSRRHLCTGKGFLRWLNCAEDWTKSRYPVLAGLLLLPTRLPFAPCVKGVDLDGPLSRTRRTDHPLRTLGQGFSILDHFGSPLRSLDLQIALHRLSLYTLAVDDYLVGRSAAQSLSLLGVERSFAIHSLMGLTVAVDPDTDGDGGTPRGGAPCDDDDDELLDLCHVAALIYSVLCVLPLPAAPFPASPPADQNTLGATELRERMVRSNGHHAVDCIHGGALRPWEQVTAAPAGRGSSG